MSDFSLKNLPIFQVPDYQTLVLAPETTFPAMHPSGDPGPQPLYILPLLSEDEEEEDRDCFGKVSKEESWSDIVKQ